MVKLLLGYDPLQKFEVKIRPRFQSIAYFPYGFPCKVNRSYRNKAVKILTNILPMRKGKILVGSSEININPNKTFYAKARD